jgi:nucleotide-binding universal stress UspA family protein
MSEIKKILFPVDLSESADEIASCVIEFQKRFQAELHLLFDARVFGYFSAIYVDATMISTMEDAVIEGAQRSLQEYKNKYFNELPEIKARVVSGYASDEIIKYCDEEEIDLVIMGTHGRSGLGKVVFGSVAEQVLRTSRVPVTVVNPFRKHHEEQRALDRQARAERTMKHGSLP